MPIQKLPIRDGDVLPDDAVVVRGGLMATPSLEVAVATSFEEFGLHLLTVFGHPSLSAIDLWQQTVELNGRYKKVRVTTAGVLRSRGFELIPSFDVPHYDLLLPGPPTLDIWGRLDHCFQQPIVKP